MTNESTATAKDRSYRAVLAEHREDHRLLDEYLNVVDEARPAYAQPITEPHRGVNVLEATRTALIRTGATVTDSDQIHWAWAYIQKLLDEVNAIADPIEPTLVSVVANHFFAFSDCVPTVKDWKSWPDDDRASDAKDLAEALAEHPKLLAQVVELAMPAVLKAVIREDARQVEELRRESVIRAEAVADTVRMLGLGGDEGESAPDGQENSDA